MDEFINDDDKDSLDGFIVFSNDESNSDVEIISMEGGAKGGASGVSSRGSSVSRGVDDKGKIKTSDITGSNIGGIDGRLIVRGVTTGGGALVIETGVIKIILTSFMIVDV